MISTATADRLLALETIRRMHRRATHGCELAAANYAAALELLSRPYRPRAARHEPPHKPRSP